MGKEKLAALTIGIRIIDGAARDLEAARVRLKAILGENPCHGLGVLFSYTCGARADLRTAIAVAEICRVEMGAHLNGEEDPESKGEK